MKPIGIVISVIIIVFSLILLGSSISNLQNIDEKYDVKTQEIVTEINRLSNEELDICTTTDEIESLESCKAKSIPKFIEMCNDDQTSDLSVCSDDRLKEFSNTIDERIKSASVDHSSKSDIIKSKIDTLQSELIELCSVEENDLDSCKNSMLEIKNECMKNEQKDIPSCNDPRIQMILDKESELNLSASEQSPWGIMELDSYDAQIIRDCSRENEIFAEDYMSKIIDQDAISQNQKDTIQINVERMSICSADIEEIEDRGYGRGSATGYWDSVAKMLDQICAKTGQYCGEK